VFFKTFHHKTFQDPTLSGSSIASPSHGRHVGIINHKFKKYEGEGSL